MDALIAIPVYNEESTVIPILTRVRRFVRGPILVIDDGSTDDSAERAREVEGVVLLSHERNEGYGKSLIDAFAYCLGHSYSLLVTLDCDEQHEPALIPQFVEAGRHWDIVSGTRYSPMSPVAGSPPADRSEINREITRRINDLTGYRLTDAFCGFKAYRRSALERVSPTETGYGMPLQLWLQAAGADLTVIELPVPRIYCDTDRSFGQDLDSKQKRLAYYHGVIDEELARGQSERKTSEAAGGSV